MRHPLLLAVLSLTSLLCAQTTGRHFHRDSRLPATPAAVRVVEAAATTGTVAPLQKLRSGRPWPRHHFGRLPQQAAGPAVQVADAAARSAGPRRGFWRPRD
ncbi:MAG: hypothetical protein FJ265_05135 [Planctomycetes bacterium]|nr:hypothetical protein [Planctomycetota bacterium]